MSRINDMKWIWIVSPIKENDGELIIAGYTRLRKEFVCCVPANGYIDYKTYGTKINRTYKFSSNKEIDIAIDGGDGIYFNEPKEGKDLLFHNPELISEPVTHFGKQWEFVAERQVY